MIRAAKAGRLARAARPLVVIAGLVTLIAAGRAAAGEIPARAADGHSCEKKACQTPFGELKAIERKGVVKVTVLRGKGGPRRELMRAAEGREFVVLTFAGACREARSCEDDGHWAKTLLFFITSGATPGAIVRTSGGELRDGSGRASETGHLILLSKGRRQVAFETNKGADGLAWIYGHEEIPLAAFLPASAPATVQAD